MAKDKATTKQVEQPAEKTLDETPAEQRDQSNRTGAEIDDHSRDQAVASGDYRTPQYQRDNTPGS